MGGEREACVRWCVGLCASVHVRTWPRFSLYVCHVPRYDHGYEVPIHYLAKKIADENQVRRLVMVIVALVALGRVR